MGKATWNEFSLNEHDKLLFWTSTFFHQGVLLHSPPYLYFSSSKMFVTKIPPIHSPLLWRIFVIFWSPSFTSSGKIFIIERVTTLPPTWNFYDLNKRIISFNQFNDTSKDHCPRGTFALITKTTLLTFIFRLTGCLCSFDSMLELTVSKSIEPGVEDVSIFS